MGLKGGEEEEEERDRKKVGRRWSKRVREIESKRDRE